MIAAYVCLEINTYMPHITYLIICISMEHVQRPGDGKNKKKKITKIRYIFAHIDLYIPHNICIKGADNLTEGMQHILSTMLVKITSYCVHNYC